MEMSFGPLKVMSVYQDGGSGLPVDIADVDLLSVDFLHEQLC